MSQFECEPKCSPEEIATLAVLQGTPDMVKEEVRKLKQAEPIKEVFYLE